MKLPEKLPDFLRARPLNRTRIFSALAIAVAADALQFFLGPFGWVLVDQAIDAVAMIATIWLLGFHILLLPTFVAELIPVVDELPTWTACVAAVVALRRHEQTQPPTPPTKPVIEV